MRPKRSATSRLHLRALALTLTLFACNRDSGDAPSNLARAEPAPAPPTAAPTPVPEAPPTGYAVARIGARLFAASTGAAGFELPPLGTGPTATAGITVNVIGDKDGRLEIETLAQGSLEHHCAGTLQGLADFRLRMYMNRDDLLSVSTKPTSLEYPSGTTIRLAPGVPVGPGEGLVLAAGVPINATVPADSLGHLFEPDVAFLSETREPLVQFGIAPGGDGSLITVRNACLELTSLVRATAVPNATRVFDPETVTREVGLLGIAPIIEEQILGGMLGGEFGRNDGVWLGMIGTARLTEYHVKAGASVRWTDGERVGQATSDHTFFEAPRDRGGNSCFDVPLTDEARPTIVLCFAPTDVTTIAPAPTGTPLSQVRMADVTVAGPVDKDILRRIVRHHLDEVRHCYDQGLARDPAMRGRVEIEFTIGAKGKVSASEVSSTTLRDRIVGKCIAKAVKGWKFVEPPSGSDVEVSVPFDLAPP